jgi:NAD+ synthase (glutamine-hydrolysing)
MRRRIGGKGVVEASYRLRGASVPPRVRPHAGTYAEGVAQLRVALAQASPVVGDITGNTELVLARARDAAGRGAHVVLLPEMAITGYPAEDLVLRASFNAASRAALERLASDLAEQGLGELVVLVGYLDRCAQPTPRLGRPVGEPQNAAAVLHRGEVVARYAKHHLPNYGVFDEYRYFVPGDVAVVVRVHGVDVAVTICEDMWQDGGSFAVAGQAGAGLIACLNASPYERGKEAARISLAQRRATETGTTIAFVNMVGGQDELVFDGDSFVVAADGTLLARAPQFEDTLLVADLELPAADRNDEPSVDAGDGTRMQVRRVVAQPGVLASYDAEPPPLAEPAEELAQVWGALTLATRDYVLHNGFTSVVIGLSGGIDSAVVATIAADALGPDLVHTVGLPSRYSSEGSVSDARALAERQRLHWSVMPIGSMVEAYETVFAEGETGELKGLAEENLQARVRGTLLMALSNQVGHLVLTTGNKSELATGFSTLYGDSAGGFAPIKDVPKSLVWELARWRNRAAEAAGEAAVIPVEIIEKAPSAELSPGQLDEDRLPPYELLDRVLEDYVLRDMGRDEMVEAGYDPELVDRVVRLVDVAEYKRRQDPPGPKVTSRNFGRDRRLPITNAWRETGRTQP